MHHCFVFLKLVNALLKGCQRLHIPGAQNLEQTQVDYMIMDLDHADHGLLRLRNVIIQAHGNCCGRVHYTQKCRKYILCPQHKKQILLWMHWMEELNLIS
jgi:hypothetical protein